VINLQPRVVVLTCLMLMITIALHTYAG